MKNIYGDEDDFWYNYIPPTKAERIKQARFVHSFIVSRKWNHLIFRNGGRGIQYVRGKDEKYKVKHIDFITSTHPICMKCGSRQHTTRNCEREFEYIPWYELDRRIDQFTHKYWVDADTDTPPNSCWFEIQGNGNGNLLRHFPMISIMLDGEIIPTINIKDISYSEKYYENFQKYIFENDLYKIGPYGNQIPIFDKVKLVKTEEKFPWEHHNDNVRNFLRSIDIWTDWYKFNSMYYTYVGKD